MKCSTVLLVVAALIANAPPAQGQCDLTAPQAAPGATAAKIRRYHDYRRFTGGCVQLVYTNRWE